MRVLLDTHVVLWSLYGGRGLSARAQELLSDSDTRPLMSMATLWEAAIKLSLQRRDFSVPESFPDDVASAGIELLPVTARHAWAVRELTHFHGDPFDRMIIAQAKAEQLLLITHDRAMARYGAEVVIA